MTPRPGGSRALHAGRALRVRAVRAWSVRAALPAPRVGALLACALLAWGCSDPSGPGAIVTGRDGAAMVAIPAGSFKLGTDDALPDLPPVPPGKAPLHPYEVLQVRAGPAFRLADERPARTVRLGAFALDRTEVTNASYRRFLAAAGAKEAHASCHPGEPPGKDHTPRYLRPFNPLLADPAYAAAAPFGPDSFAADEQPVVGVDWFDAHAYCAFAGKRLPTEAEWERACRGTDGRRWPFGDSWRWGLANTGGEKHGQDIPAKGREKDGFIYPAPVGSFPEGASPAGCLDLAGNAAEWVADLYAADAYATGPAEDPRGPATGSRRVIRGGSSRSAPSQVRCASRDAQEPLFRTFTLGFRCAEDL